MKLDVPLFLQNENSRDCGPIALKMLLAYYGRHVEYNDIASRFVHVQSGTTIPQLGSYLLDNGFDAEIVTINPHMFSYNMIGWSDQQAIRDHLAARQPNLKNDDRKTVAQHMIDFMDKGGSYNLKIPDRQDVETELAAKRPVITIVASLYLHGHAGFNFHFNVITGLDGDIIHVNDSLRNDQGEGQFSLPVDGFFHAMHSAAFGDLDNDSLLLVRPKT